MLEWLNNFENSEKKPSQSSEQQKPFDPIRQKLEWSVALINKEYKEKFSKELPWDIKNLFSKALTWKQPTERDKLFDDVIHFIKNKSNPDWDIRDMLKDDSNEKLQIDHEANLDNLVNSISSLDWKWKSYDWIRERIINLKNLVDKNDFSALDTEVKSILAELHKPEVLAPICLDLQEQDRKNWTNNYEAFKSSIISLDSSFRRRIPDMETKNMLALWTDTLNKTIITNNELKHATNDGFIVSASLDNSNRNISRPWAKYALKSDIEAKVAQEEANKITTDLAERVNPLENSLSTVQAMRKHIEQLQGQDTDIESLKTELQAFSPELYAEFNLDMADDVNSILRVLEIQEVMINQEIDKLEFRANRARAKLIEKTKTRAREKDAIKKDTLKFFSQIGLDMFSQAETDTVFEWLNQNQAVRESLWLNAMFDIENWILGYESAFKDWKTLSLESKMAFVRVFNKMLTGSTEYPIWFDGLGNCVFYESEQHAENKQFSSMFDMQFFGNQRLGSGNRVLKMIENLKRESNI